MSLVVMAYNQAEFIADTIRGVLAQDFPRLEIILSDDGSTDGTYEVMARMTADYKGPHEIRLFRNSPNMGFVGHLNHVFTLCRGALIVYNPGDDISLPERTSKLVAAAEASDALLVHSEAYEIDARGQRTGTINSRQAILDGMTLERAATSMSLCTGATCAWRPELMTRFGPIVEEPTYDDLILCFRAMLLDRVAFVAEPLMEYRVGVGISHLPDIDQTANDPFAAQKAKFHKKLAVRIATLSQRIRDCQAVGEDNLAEVMQAELHGARYMSNLIRDPGFDRWSRLRSWKALKYSMKIRNRLKMKMKEPTA
ncbi:glycosyltransferase [Sagittula sp. S175]|uniref:glycosyltransferase n=1 Tax=Sagittula sp. S175 TaxID=3415129 RepID=UPI003C7A5AA2